MEICKIMFSHASGFEVLDLDFYLILCQETSFPVVFSRNDEELAIETCSHRIWSILKESFGFGFLFDLNRGVGRVFFIPYDFDPYHHTWDRFLELHLGSLEAIRVVLTIALSVSSLGKEIENYLIKAHAALTSNLSSLRTSLASRFELDKSMVYSMLLDFLTSKVSSSQEIVSLPSFIPQNQEEFVRKSLGSLITFPSGERE